MELARHGSAVLGVGGLGIVESAVVDTSVLHAYLAADDRLHVAAKSLVSAVKKLVAPAIVVHELVWSLRRRYDRVRATQLVLGLLAAGVIEVVPVEREDIEFALSDLKYYYDLLVLSVAKRLGLPLATLDGDMIRLAKRYCIPLVNRSPRSGGCPPRGSSRRRSDPLTAGVPCGSRESEPTKFTYV
ncbi:PIN domain-containing protein [Hyperthermus butylicus]|uniref:Ribonuclease VapC n=1 Tax=Hyperthermus butylicus (strain DSM 5456 / JCM 9403 / PLM1-5) TaxID=415426 RepID=A2BJN5_HYPBU|nr:PIN domain-containing protein [Hyperthermus butylicus]ABM80196.1 putative nucleic acid binding protein [Hyperthermus butylicus DSM 5456]